MSQLKDSQAERVNSPFLHLFVLFRPSVHWIRLTHIGEGNLHYSVLIQMLMLFRNTFMDTLRIIFNQISGTHGPAKLKYKMNHCTGASERSTFSSVVFHNVRV